MRKQHMEQVERWANFVRNNPGWKKIHTEFIDSQFKKAEESWKKMIKQPGGKEKIKEIYKIKNIKGYPFLK